MSSGFTRGCLCGVVRYESTGDATIAGHCHCTDCRKSSGSGHASHMAVPKKAVLVTGTVTIYDKAGDRGNIVSRAFCPICGAPVYSLNAAMPDLIFLRASSLDDPEVFKPQMIVYASRAASWDHMDPRLQSFPTMPEVGAQKAGTGSASRSSE
jgi:hypothetical protein